VSFGSSGQIVSFPGEGAITSAPTIVLASSQESDIFGVTSQGYIIGWMYSNMPPVTGWYYGTSGAASWSAAVAVRSKMGASNNDLYFRKGNDASLYLLHPQRLGASGSQYIAWGAETYLGRTLYSSPGATSSGSTGSCDDVYVLGSDNYYWGRDNCGTIYDWYQVTLRP
jgi:hypothetical protein